MEGDSSHFTRYLLSDPFMRFYFGFLRPLQKKSRQREHYFTHFVMPSARFRSWLGLAFELLCLQHQDVIAKILGFSGIEYSAGPWSQHSKQGVVQGAQLDLVFDRADRVLTICEVKFRDAPIGVEVVAEMEQKLSRIAFLKKRTVQKVLITKAEPSRELRRSSYLSRIITTSDLIAAHA